ncbi:hypothetical protein BVX98_07195, partial [bacterium F11]
MEYEIINNQAKVRQSTSISDSFGVDGSPSHSISVTNYTNNVRTGRLVGADGESASWSVDFEGNETRSGSYEMEDDREVITTIGGTQRFYVLFGQAKSYLSTSNSVTTLNDGSVNTQDLLIHTRYNMETGQLDDQWGEGTWVTIDPRGGNFVASGETRQDYIIRTGQARMSLSETWRTSDGPVSAHSTNRVVNTYTDEGMLETSESESHNFGVDDLYTHTNTTVVYRYDDNKRQDGSIHSDSTRHEYDSTVWVQDPLDAVDPLAVETIESDTTEDYLAFDLPDNFWTPPIWVDQPFTRTRRVETDNTTVQSSLDTAWSQQEILTTYAYDDEGFLIDFRDENGNGKWDEGEIRTYGKGTSTSHSGHDHPDIDEPDFTWEQVEDHQWFDTTKGDIEQEYELLPIKLNGETVVNVAKLAKSVTHSETHGRDSSYNHQILTVTNTYNTDELNAAVDPIRIKLLASKGVGETLEAHSGRDEAIDFDFDPKRRGLLDEHGWWDTTIGTIEQNYEIFFDSLAKLTSTKNESITLSREGSFSHSTTEQYNAYNEFGRLMEEFDTNGDGFINGENGDERQGERTEAYVSFTSHSGSDRIFLYDLDPSDHFRILSQDWKQKYDGDPFEDANGNGIWDEGEIYEDRNEDGEWTQNERQPFKDQLLTEAKNHDFMTKDNPADPWWDVNSGSTYQRFKIMRGQQARIDWADTASKNFSIDGSFSQQTNHTDYTYDRRNRGISSLTMGSVVNDDGNGNYSVGITKQISERINGQLRVTDNWSQSDPASTDGSVSHQASYSHTAYDELGRIDVEGGETFGETASWSIDSEGNITQSGELDEEGFVDVDKTTQNNQTYKVLNGQAKVLTTQTVSVTENIDGSTFEQDLLVTNEYEERPHQPEQGIIFGRLKGGDGQGTWEAWDGDPDVNDGKGHLTTGVIWQEYDTITGQNRMKKSAQHQVPPAKQEPNIPLAADGKWDLERVPVPLFAQREDAPIYAHPESYSLTEYDENGRTLWSQSASNVFTYDGFLNHSVQKIVYEETVGPTGRPVRDKGYITGITNRFDYVSEDSDGHGFIKDDAAIEISYFDIVETYGQKQILLGEDLIDVTRRVHTDNKTRSYGLDGSYNKQHLETTFAYNDKAVMVDLVDTNGDDKWNEGEQRTHGLGSFISHSGRDNDEIPPGMSIEDSWNNTLENAPEEMWDTTVGTLEQSYRVFEFPPESMLEKLPFLGDNRVGLARIVQTDTVSETIGRDGSYNHQFNVVRQAYDPNTFRLVLAYDDDQDGKIGENEQTKGTGRFWSHGGRNEDPESFDGLI